MRTLNEMEHAPHYCEKYGDTYAPIFIDELHHLIAIVKAAHGSVAYNNASVAIKEAVRNAEKAGLFGGIE